MKIKSIFTKQLLLYVGTLFANFILVGMVLSLVYTQHYMDEAKEDLINQGMKISKEYKKVTMIDLRYINTDFQIMARLEDYDQLLFLYNVITFSEDENIIKLNMCK